MKRDFPEEPDALRKRAARLAGQKGWFHWAYEATPAQCAAERVRRLRQFAETLAPKGAQP